jgi:hypothetical protein
MDERERSAEPVEDLEVPRGEAQDVKGGVATGDVTGDGPAALAGDPDQPIVAGRIPGLHKVGDVTLKRG